MSANTLNKHRNNIPLPKQPNPENTPADPDYSPNAPLWEVQVLKILLK